MENYVFEQWLKHVFVDQVKELTKSKPVVLLYDGHGSHIGSSRKQHFTRMSSSTYFMSYSLLMLAFMALQKLNGKKL